MWSMTANVTNFESEIFKANHQRGRLSGSRGNLFWFERLFYRVECSFSCNSAEHGQAVDLPLCLIDLRFLNKFFLSLSCRMKWDELESEKAERTKPMIYSPAFHSVQRSAISSLSIIVCVYRDSSGYHRHCCRMIHTVQTIHVDHDTHCVLHCVLQCGDVQNTRLVLASDGTASDALHMPLHTLHSTCPSAFRYPLTMWERLTS